MMTFQSRGFTLLLHQVTLFLKEKLEVFLTFLEHFQNTLLHILYTIIFECWQEENLNSLSCQGKSTSHIFREKN